MTVATRLSLVSKPIPRFSMLHAKKAGGWVFLCEREWCGLVCDEAAVSSSNQWICQVKGGGGGGRGYLHPLPS